MKKGKSITWKMEALLCVNKARSRALVLPRVRHCLQAGYILDFLCYNSSIGRRSGGLPIFATQHHCKDLFMIREYSFISNQEAFQVSVSSRGLAPSLVQEHSTNPLKLSLISEKVATAGLPVLSGEQQAVYTHASVRKKKFADQVDIAGLVEKQYLDGRFRNLLKEVIATPEALLAAYKSLKTQMSHESQNKDLALERNLEPVGTTIESQYHHLSVDSKKEFTSDDPGSKFFCGISHQLIQGSFDIQAHCSEFHLASQQIGRSLKVPSISLKIVQQAVRMVLEIIYEPQFSNISHGCRLRRGRHTALKDIKHVFRNPEWWICIDIQKRFDRENMTKMICILEEQIVDEDLFGLLHQMFHANLLNLEFGGCPKGQGFPHEHLLSPILMNIYLDQFDKEILHLRQKVESEDFNKLLEDEDFSEILNMLSRHTDAEPPVVRPLQRCRGRKNSKLSGKALKVLPNRTKVYACRYIDEVLLATTGPKKLACIIKDHMAAFLVSDLHLGVNPSKTILRHAVFENVRFLGMDIQAVPLSEIQPSRTDKEIRAIKESKERTKALALQKQIHAEADLRKLGRKLLTHAVKKAKLLKSGKQLVVGQQAKDVLTMWTKQVVPEFLATETERDLWFQKLSKEGILSKEVTRQQLPKELIDAYDDFHWKVEKFLGPSSMLQPAHKAEVTSRVDISGIDSVQSESLCIKINAPIKDLLEKLRICGLINIKGRPQPLDVLFTQDDVHIVQWYSTFARKWLNFFCCCQNFAEVKSIVNYHVRWSCIYTLKEKHNAKKRDILRRYTKDLLVTSSSGSLVKFFPSEPDIKGMGTTFLTDPVPVASALDVVLSTVRCTFPPRENCVVTCCQKRATGLHKVHILQTGLKKASCNKKKQEKAVGTLLSALAGKGISLCEEHYAGLNTGKITLQNASIKSSLFEQLSSGNIG